MQQTNMFTVRSVVSSFTYDDDEDWNAGWSSKCWGRLLCFWRNVVHQNHRVIHSVDRIWSLRMSCCCSQLLRSGHFSKQYINTARRRLRDDVTYALQASARDVLSNPNTAHKCAACAYTLINTVVLFWNQKWCPAGTPRGPWWGSKSV